MLCCSVRLPGLSIVYTQATSGLPAVLQHLLVNMPALHEVTVLLTIRVIPRPYTSDGERFLVRRSQQLAGMYRVIARYGYMEQVNHGPEFVRQLIGCLMRFVTQQQPHGHGTKPDHAGSMSPRSGGSRKGTSHTGGDSLSEGAEGLADAVGVLAPRLSHEGVVIELQPVDETAVMAPAGGEDGGLARWSRVPISPVDSEIVEEMASAAGEGLVLLLRIVAFTVCPGSCIVLLQALSACQDESRCCRR